MRMFKFFKRNKVELVQPKRMIKEATDKEEDYNFHSIILNDQSEIETITELISFLPVIKSEEPLYQEAWYKNKLYRFKYNNVNMKLVFDTKDYRTITLYSIDDDKKEHRLAMIYMNKGGDFRDYKEIVFYKSYAGLEDVAVDALLYLHNNLYSQAVLRKAEIENGKKSEQEKTDSLKQDMINKLKNQNN